MEQSGGAGEVYEHQAQPQVQTPENGVSSRWDQPLLAAEQPPPLAQPDGAPQDQPASAAPDGTDDGRGRSRKRNRRACATPTSSLFPPTACRAYGDCRVRFACSICTQSGSVRGAKPLKLLRALPRQVGCSRDGGRRIHCGSSKSRSGGRGTRGARRRGARGGAAEAEEPVGDEGGAAEHGADHHLDRRAAADCAGRRHHGATPAQRHRSHRSLR